MSEFDSKPLSQFSSDPQAGILKTAYAESPLAAALKRKRQRLAETKGMDVDGGEKTDAESKSGSSIFGKG